jgi:predicted peroxiredoxin
MTSGGQSQKEVPMPKSVIICNGGEPHNLFPTFILGSAAAAMGDEVILFFTPSGAPALVKGELEETEAKGMPEMGELVRSFRSLGGRILVCDLCLEAKDLQEEDLRDGIEIVGVTTFLADTHDATRTFSF